ncbi:DinB family protein [Algirhabdus cladophorae]|uniref:DinB family protein n=1 Tax=Algirhabdus cladophorae TaxID=3377108 RepID=UPI003B848075
MARYNAWQNSGIIAEARVMDQSELTKDRGAFFGSLMHTLSHLLWADTIWMSRFAGLTPPSGGIQDSATMVTDLETLAMQRFRMDGQITNWTRDLRDLDLVGNLTWMSGAAGREVTKPIALCVAHFFNHQTHHRGQIHMMLTSLGIKPQDSDLFLMPEDL